jgi:hypothetical protein
VAKPHDRWKGGNPPLKRPLQPVERGRRVTPFLRASSFLQGRRTAGATASYEWCQRGKIGYGLRAGLFLLIDIFCLAYRVRAGVRTCAVAEVCSRGGVLPLKVPLGEKGHRMRCNLAAKTDSRFCRAAPINPLANESSYSRSSYSRSSYRGTSTKRGAPPFLLSIRVTLSLNAPFSLNAPLSTRYGNNHQWGGLSAGRVGMSDVHVGAVVGRIPECVMSQ